MIMTIINIIVPSIDTLTSVIVVTFYPCLARSLVTKVAATETKHEASPIATITGSLQEKAGSRRNGVALALLRHHPSRVQLDQLVLRLHQLQLQKHQ